MIYERIWLEKPVMRLDNQTMTTVLQVQDGFVIERHGDTLVITHPKASGAVQHIPWARVNDSRARPETVPAEKPAGRAADGKFAKPAA